MSHVRHSSQACALLEKDLKLQMANATRWNSQIRMIKSLFLVSDSNMQMLEYDGKLNVHEINVTKDLLEILTPFKSATDLTQGENQVTVSVILAVIRGLRNEISRLEKISKTTLVTTIKSSVESWLSQYEDLTLQLAAVFDPSRKLAWCTPEESNTLKQVIIEKVTISAFHSMKSNEIVLPTSSIALPEPKRSKPFEFMQIPPLSSQVSDLDDNSAKARNT